MADSQVSPTRLYLGNLPRDVTKEEILAHFETGPGKITETKLMAGFGFIEYEDATDARDVVPHFHGGDFKGNRLTVQFARGSRPREFMPMDQSRPRFRRTIFRMQITGLQGDTSWQDLKDFARKSEVDVVYSEVSRDRDGRGLVEFENAGDLAAAVDKLDNSEFKGMTVHCSEDIQAEVPRDRYRSRSPAPFRRNVHGPGAGNGYPPHGGYYDDRRGPPPPRGGYRDDRDDFRRRSPPREEYYGHRSGYRSSPPRGPPRGPPMDDGYGPPRGGYGREPEPYGGGPPRRGGGYDDPYGANGYDRGGRRSPPPPPRGGGGYGGGGGGYDDRPQRGYW